MSVTMLLLILLGQSTMPIRMGLDVSGLDEDEISWYMSEGSISVLFAKSEEPINPYQGLYLWSNADARLDTLNDLSGAGVEIIVEASYTPRWVTGWYNNNTSDDIPFGEMNNRPVNTEFNDFYADLMEAMVLRWKPGGINDMGITEWGLWNEPDGVGLMMGIQELADNSGQGHLACVTGWVAYHDVGSLCAQRIRESDANATIISGGFCKISSLRYQDFWTDVAKPMIQTVFSGEYSDFPVRIDWHVIPDVLHWHPYDLMEEDSRYSSEYIPECYYDPLVIDTDDLMFSDRPDELGVLMDKDWLDMLVPFYWQNAPQYSLEHCPIYSREYWREHYTPSTVPADSFYTLWRANFFVTGNLLLTQSGRMTTIAPVVPRGTWWVWPWEGDWSPVQSGDIWRDCDRAYRTQTRFINGCTCEDFGQMDIPLLNLDVYHWEYNPPNSTDYHVVHALRTFRETEEVGLYDPDEISTISLNVDPATDYVVVWDMIGEEYQEYHDIQNNSIDIPVTGYIQYVLEYPASITNSIEAANIPFKITGPDEGSLIFTTSSEVRGIIAFDIVGRCVWISPESFINDNQTGEVSFTWRHSQTDIPAGCYLVIGNDFGENIVVRRKVVIR